MTESENIDSTQSTENLTVTSDAAFERVTNDFKMEDEVAWWYMKQNTAWLVQEIPNISFLDVADTLLESNKTLFWKENWALRVWVNAKSIETQPQDTILLRLDQNKIYIMSPWYTDNWIDFDSDVSSWNYTTSKPDNTYMFNWYKVKILETWYYSISYWWTLKPNSATNFTVLIASNSTTITNDRFVNWTYPEILSWWKSIPNIYLEAWDIVWMKIQANDAIEMYKGTYLSVQFQQYTL